MILRIFLLWRELSETVLYQGDTCCHVRSKYIVRCPLAGVMQLRSKKALAIRASSGAIVRSIGIPTLSNHSKQ